MLDIALWSGRANRTLAEGIAQSLQHTLEPIAIQSFSDGETHIKVSKSFKAKSIYIIQSLCSPVHHHLMELLLLCDAAHQTGCTQISVVIPYLAYARQDKLERDAYTPLAAKLIADLLASRKLHRIISMDLHSPMVASFFSTPLELLSTTPLFAATIHQDLLSSITENATPLIVSPDLGGHTRAQNLATALKTDCLILDKKMGHLRIFDSTFHKNIYANKKYVHMHNRDCILIDDIVDSGKTLCNAGYFLKQQGAAQVRAYATHAVLSGDALARLLDSDLSQLQLTDTIPLSTQSQSYLEKNPKAAEKLKILSVAHCFAQAINAASLGL